MSLKARAASISCPLKDGRVWESREDGELFLMGSMGVQQL